MMIALFQPYLIVEFCWNTMHYNWYDYIIFFSNKEAFTLFFNKKIYVPYNILSSLKGRGTWQICKRLEKAKRQVT